MDRPLPERFWTKVVGVTFHADYPKSLYSLRDRLDRAELEASLIREAENEYDPNAVAVLAGGEIVGHVPREVAARLAPVLDGGTRYRVVEAEVLVNPEHTDRPGMSICVEVV